MEPLNPVCMNNRLAAFSKGKWNYLMKFYSEDSTQRTWDSLNLGTQKEPGCQYSYSIITVQVSTEE